MRADGGAASWFLNALQAWFADAAEPMRSRWDVHGNRALETVEDLRRAVTPHWAALALMGSSSCAYDWIAGDDAIEWLGNPVELFDLDAAKIPASRAEVMALMRPGAAATYLLASRSKSADDTPPRHTSTRTVRMARTIRG